MRAVDGAREKLSLETLDYMVELDQGFISLSFPSTWCSV